MAESRHSPREGLEDIETDFADEDDGNFNTPPESPDDVRLQLSPALQAELNDLESTEEYIKKNQEWIARSAESVRELKVTMDKLIGQTTSRKTELDKRKQRMKEMKREIDEISMEAIQKEEEELKKLIDVERSNKQVNGDSVEGGDSAEGSDMSTEPELSSSLNDMRTKVEAYREHLGLHINISQEWNEFIFTNVDTQSPDATFSIKLAVIEEDYKCVACEPPVPKLDELMDQLNTHHDLQQFMTTLRQEFKALVNKEN